MKLIVLIAVIGIMLLQSSGAIPLSSVGGPITTALAFFTAALAVAIHKAWTMKRGLLGWIVNIAVSFAGTFIATQLGGLVMIILISFFTDLNGSLAATGAPVFAISLAGTTLATLLGSWGALQIVNRWR